MRVEIDSVSISYFVVAFQSIGRFVCPVQLCIAWQSQTATGRERQAVISFPSVNLCDSLRAKGRNLSKFRNRISMLYTQRMDICL